MPILTKKIDVKGFEEKDIRIEYDGEYITVIADRREGIFKHKSKIQCIYVGQIDINEIKARVDDNDILTITTPMKNSLNRFFDENIGNNNESSEKLSKTEISKLKGFINMFAEVNDLYSLQQFFIDFSKLETKDKIKHPLYEELKKYEISYLYENLINLHYYIVLSDRGMYKNASSMFDRDNTNLIKLFIVESVLDGVICNLKEQGVSQKNITTVLSNYISTNGKLSPKIKAYLKSKNQLELLEKINSVDILFVVRMYGYDKISTYVANALSSDYNKPKKIYAK